MLLGKHTSPVVLLDQQNGDNACCHDSLADWQFKGLVYHIYIYMDIHNMYMAYCSDYYSMICHFGLNFCEQFPCVHGWSKCLER